MAYSSSSSTRGRESKHDVFISFRGEDTRKKFTDHLYAGLEQKGISTFRDDEKLERGTPIGPGLFKAIEESRFAVVILSSDYASSRWCLIELAKIVDCMKKTGLVVLPVFHYVDPSDVRNQRDIYAEAFKKHEESFKDSNEEDVHMWKAALTEVANISGWDLRDRHESKVILEIAGRISSELNRKLSKTNSENLVGIDSRVKEILDLCLCERLGGFHLVGICGIGGIGKTTLAQEIYDRISGDFEASSFIANVSEETKNQGLVSLQKQLLSKILMQSKIRISDVYEGIYLIRKSLCNKRVLIVLDDVDGQEQLEALVGKHDWFGLGSRIILTSRDSHLFRRCGVSYIYICRGLNDDEALELFSRRAFEKPYPIEGYVELSKDFVNYAKGIPLAITVLGSFLFARSIREWKNALARPKELPVSSIIDVLQKSLDGLTNSQKQLFLDIACFFEGENINCIRDILQNFGYFPKYNIAVLMDKHLVTIDEWGTIRMNGFLQFMGQEIVRLESPKEPGRRSRLWHYEDVYHVLMHDTGTEFIEGIVLKEPVHKKVQLSVESLSKMKNLRLLKIQNVLIPNHLNYLSNELCIIEWHGYPLNSMPANFQPNKLVELKMHCSAISQLWERIVSLDNLKLIDLSDSQKLIETPDFSEAPNLKHLILQRCTILYKIHPSIGNLRRLIQLDLNGCKCLEILPPKIKLESLEVFDLSGCLKVKKFPKIVGNMSCLSKLDLDKTAIKKLPVSVQNLTSLTSLSLKDCKNLSSLTDAICTMTSLKTLILSGCSKLDKLPKNLGNLEGLEVLDVSGTAIEELPSSVEHLIGLTFLSLKNCKNLSSLTDATCTMTSLKSLILSGCSKLDKLPENLGNLEGLEVLDVSGSAIEELPSSVEHLIGLTFLSLRNCKNLSSLTDAICTMVSLKTLILSGCAKLDELPENLGNLEGLEVIDVSGAAIKALPSSVVLLRNLRVISLCRCEEPFKDIKKEDVNMWKAALTEIGGISGWDLRNRLVMSSIDLYLYYGGEPCSDVTYGVTYEGPGKKLEIIQLKKRREINLKKLKKKIMKELDLDHRLYDIKIIYRAPYAVFSDRIVFTPIEIKRDKHVKIMIDRINSTPQLKAAELYISVKLCIEVSGEDVQQTTLEGGGGEEFQSLHADSHLTLTPCTTVGGHTLPCQETPTPMEVCRSSYQQECIQSLRMEDEDNHNET